MASQVFRYLVYEQDGAFVAQCLDVDVASEGDTQEQAIANLTEALELRFEGGDFTVNTAPVVSMGEITVHA